MAPSFPFLPSAVFPQSSLGGGSLTPPSPLTAIPASTLPPYIPRKRGSEDVEFISSNPIKRRKVEDSNNALPSGLSSLSALPSPSSTGDALVKNALHGVLPRTPGGHFSAISPLFAHVPPTPTSTPPSISQPPTTNQAAASQHIAHGLPHTERSSPSTPAPQVVTQSQGILLPSALPEAANISAKQQAIPVNPTSATSSGKPPHTPKAVGETPRETVNQQKPAQALPSYHPQPGAIRTSVSGRKLTDSDAPHDVVPMSERRGISDTTLSTHPDEQSEDDDTARPVSVPMIDRFSFARGFSASARRQSPSPPPLSPKQLPNTITLSALMRPAPASIPTTTTQGGVHAHPHSQPQALGPSAIEKSAAVIPASSATSAPASLSPTSNHTISDLAALLPPEPQGRLQSTQTPPKSQISCPSAPRIAQGPQATPMAETRSSTPQTAAPQEPPSASSGHISRTAPAPVPLPPQPPSLSLAGAPLSRTNNNLPVTSVPASQPPTGAISHHSQNFSRQVSTAPATISSNLAPTPVSQPMPILMATSGPTMAHNPQDGIHGTSMRHPCQACAAKRTQQAYGGGRPSNTTHHHQNHAAQYQGQQYQQALSFPPNSHTHHHGLPMANSELYGIPQGHHHSHQQQLQHHPHQPQQLQHPQYQMAHPYGMAHPGYMAAIPGINGLQMAPYGPYGMPVAMPPMSAPATTTAMAKRASAQSANVTPGPAPSAPQPNAGCQLPTPIPMRNPSRAPSGPSTVPTTAQPRQSCSRPPRPSTTIPPPTAPTLATTPKVSIPNTNTTCPTTTTTTDNKSKSQNHTTYHTPTSPNPKKNANLILDIATTAESTFPFATVASRHSLPIHKVRDIFNAIIQIPLLRCPTDKRRHGKLAGVRKREYERGKKEVLGARGISTKPGGPPKRGEERWQPPPLGLGGLCEVAGGIGIGEEVELPF